ncbi:MAG: hypothetical protein O3B87_05950 [bacterium]|nr:hypothetical protein [bacterium]
MNKPDATKPLRKQSYINETIEVDDLSPNNTSNNNQQILSSLMDERKNNRREMLKHVLSLTYLSFGLLALIVIVQGTMRIVTDVRDFTLLDNYQLNIFAVSVFGQMIGVIIVIVKSLWDDEQYLKKLWGRASKKGRTLIKSKSQSLQCQLSFC